MTTIIAAVFPIYFYKVVASELPPGAATRRFAIANAAAMLALAISAPVLGAIADLLPVKKRMLGFFIAIGSIAAVAMFGIKAGDWLPAPLEGRQWLRWIDTSLESPEDIVPWKEAKPIAARSYHAGPRSVVMLFV